MDEATQDDAPDEFGKGPASKRRPRPRGTRGDRQAQAARYYQRNGYKLRLRAGVSYQHRRDEARAEARAESN